MIRGIWQGGSLFGINLAVQMWSEVFDWEDHCLAVLIWSEGFDWEGDCLVSPRLFKYDQRHLTGRITVWYYLDCWNVIRGIWLGGSLFCITRAVQIWSEGFVWEDHCLVSPGLHHWEDHCLVSPGLFRCDQRGLTGRMTVWYHWGCSNVIRGIWQGGSLFGTTLTVQMWSEKFDREDHCSVSPWLIR